jgi:hypothetical protein
MPLPDLLGVQEGTDLRYLSLPVLLWPGFLFGTILNTCRTR